MKIKYEQVEEKTINLKRNDLRGLVRLWFLGMLSGIGLGLVFNNFIYAGLTVIVSAIALYKNDK